MKVLYTSVFRDHSGYGQACRHTLKLLDKDPELDVAIRTISFEDKKTTFPEFESLLKRCSNKKLIAPDIHLVHLTPEWWQRHAIPGVPSVGYVAWETSKIPEDWVVYCNKHADGILNPCKWNNRVLKDSGVKTPLFTGYHAPMEYQGRPTTYEKRSLRSKQGIPEDAVVFYSIFQWTERKNPIGLLKAYFSAFTDQDNVILVLKTYGSNFSNS